MSNTTIKQALINSAIKTIATVGFDRATTKLLATNANVNEVYIYRIFGGKDELFQETFTNIDKAFANDLLSALPIVYDRKVGIDIRFRKLFHMVWNHAIKDKEACSFFIRYYYSRHYTAEMSVNRKEIYNSVMKKFDLAFPYGTDTWWFFNHILDVIFSSAVKVLRGEIADDYETEEKIFNLLYPAIKPHLK